LAALHGADGGLATAPFYAKGRRMFFFFSSKLGCLGSIVVSLVLTLLLLLLFGVI
jgi:hypothetical protein